MNTKRSYFYLRLGWSVIAPAFGFSNFIMLIYMTLEIDIPLYIFAPIITGGIVTMLVFIGRTFVNKQHTTDLNLSYFKAHEAIKTDLVMWNQLEEICKKSNTPITSEFEARKKLLENAIK